MHREVECRQSSTTTEKRPLPYDKDPTLELAPPTQRTQRDLLTTFSVMATSMTDAAVWVGS